MVLIGVHEIVKRDWVVVISQFSAGVDNFGRWFDSLQNLDDRVWGKKKGRPVQDQAFGKIDERGPAR